MKLELTTEQVNQVLNALAQQPYIQVNELINTIHQQGQQQLQMEQTNSNTDQPFPVQHQENESDPLQELVADALESKNGHG